jgi:hypothetical protein
MTHMRGTTRRVPAWPARFSGLSAGRSRRSGAIPKLTNLSTAQCGGRCFGDFRTASSSRSQRRRSSSTPCSMARGTREAGGVAWTHNRPLGRTGYAGRRELGREGFDDPWRGEVCGVTRSPRAHRRLTIRGRWPSRSPASRSRSGSRRSRGSGASARSAASSRRR